MIGPGRLVLVVGPSGAGKDTLLSGARALCRDNAEVCFARRVVTRPSSDAEDHDSIDAAAFGDATARGLFAFCWQAHGHHYGIPRGINADIRAGRTVVCNVSRAVVPALRTIYANTCVVLITAPADILAQRLAARGRPTDGAADRRLTRNDAFVTFDADCIIENTAPAESGIAKLLEIIIDRAALLSAATPADHGRR